MKNLLITNYFFISFCICFLCLKQSSFAQSGDTIPTKSNHKLCVGLHVGVYGANRAATDNYDGYGVNIEGIKNDFSNSILNTQILYNYGGYRGGIDYVAQALNVNPTDWTFTEQDMPGRLVYNTAFQVGFALKYKLKKTSAIIFNIQAVKLTLNGNFTIGTKATTTGTTGATTNIYTGSIIGKEQRLNFNLGYHKVLGDNEKINFFVEGGLNIVMSKILSSQAFIKSVSNNSSYDIVINLLNTYDLPGYEFVKAKYLIGAGTGVFAGAGLVLTINPKYTIQILYNPSYDKINLGDAPKYQLNHGAGLRFYYNL